MTFPTRILVPTDFSAASEQALALALTMARGSGGTVTVLHALHAYDASGRDPNRELAATTALKAIVQAHEGSGVTVTSLLRKGEPEEEILTLAEAQNIDLVVMATQHGRSSRDGLGSVAENVVRSARRPTLIVPHAR